MTHPNKELSIPQEHDIDKILHDIKKTIIATSPNTDVLELTDKVGGFNSADKNLGDTDYSFLNQYASIMNEKNPVEKQNMTSLKFKGGLTLEEVVIELLKQQLSEWLNSNLTSIVNDIVQKEIKKLIPKDE